MAKRILDLTINCMVHARIYVWRVFDNNRGYWGRQRPCQVRNAAILSHQTLSSDARSPYEPVGVTAPECQIHQHNLQRFHCVLMGSPSSSLLRRRWSSLRQPLCEQVQVVSCCCPQDM
ncbi:hypothetical protein SCLCIDRAFT_284900 [Scleroderma citrinum Foug A]|uniref:Uncharacterized protein n=1 Tax=Scleroderma citrinum Foug A TaxID=1036808 RepID=A0A0C3D4L4_9AGAM|nr:hypothetical protein SCLCIDRAFT_284900 [Scleroderma citrinum Foug A]